MKKIFCKISPFLLLALSIGYFATITCFPHVHKDGSRILVHAHPFSGEQGSESASHQSIPHGLQQFCNLLFIQIDNVVFIQQLETGCKYLPEDYRLPLFLKLELPYSLRAPPVC